MYHLSIIITNLIVELLIWVFSNMVVVILCVSQSKCAQSSCKFVNTECLFRIFLYFVTLKLKTKKHVYGYF